MGGLYYTINSLNLFYEKFLQYIEIYGVNYNNNQIAIELLNSLKSCIRVIGYQIKLSSPNSIDNDYTIKNLIFRSYYNTIAIALYESGIFSS